MMDEKHFGYEIWERYHDGLGSTGKPKRFPDFLWWAPSFTRAKDVVQQNHDRYKKHSGVRQMDERELSWNNTPMYFWAICVWGYEDNAMKVWMPTQSSILNKIKNLALLKRKNAKGAYHLEN